MSIRRRGLRKVVLISVAFASALLGFAGVVPAQSSVGGTSISASKTMTAHLVSSHPWTLSKTAAPTSLTLDAGQSGDVSYTVGATRSPATLSAYVEGQVCVTNTGSVATQGLQIVDRLSRPPKKDVIASAPVDVSANPVLSPGEVHCYPYRVDILSGVTPGATYKDTATVSIDNKSGKGSGPSPSATTTMPTTVGTVDNATLTVADTNGSTFTFTSSSSLAYSQSFTCPADEGTQTNTVSAVGFVSGGGVSAPAPASATVTVACTNDPDLDLTKTADAASVDAGAPVGFTVTVANSAAAGTGAATGVAVNDPLPAAAGVNWSIESPTGNACVITGAVGSQVLSCSIGTLSAGASYTVHVTSPTSFASCSVLPNTATLNATNAPTQTASATTTVLCSDLGLTKTADAASVDAGAPVGFTVTVANSAAAGTGAATGVTVNDPLPAGLDWSIESQTGNACSITGAVGSEVLSCSIGSLAAGASYTVHVTAATAPQHCGTLSNTATMNSTNSPTLTANASLTVVCTNDPDLDLTKNADAASVDAGAPVGFTVTVANSAAAGTGAATGVAVNDPLPAAAGVNWSIESQTGNACVITGAVGSQVLSCSIGTLSAGASYTVHVTSPTSFASCSVLPNTATLNATNAPTQTASATTTVLCSDLGLTKTADAASVDAGAPVGFTVTVANSAAAGTGAATGVTVNDPLPAGLDWSIESQTGNACVITGAVGSQVLSCSIGTLSAGASYTVHVTSPTSFASCSVLPNTATLNATNAPTQTASATTTVLCSDLGLTKTADAASVAAGSPVGFTVTVANSAAAGTGAATGVTVNDPLPAGLDWSIESPTGNACSITGAVGSEVLSCSIGTLAAGASYAVHVTAATAPQHCGTLSNTATMNSTNAPTLSANASLTITC